MPWSTHHASDAVFSRLSRRRSLTECGTGTTLPPEEHAGPRRDLFSALEIAARRRCPHCGAMSIMPARVGLLRGNCISTVKFRCHGAAAAAGASLMKRPRRAQTLIIRVCRVPVRSRSPLGGVSRPPQVCHVPFRLVACTRSARGTLARTWSQHVQPCTTIRS